jgi:serine/threonine-protein kinase RsbW
MIRLLVPGQLLYRAVAVHAVAGACQVARRGQGPAPNGDDVALDLSADFDAKLVSAVSEAFNNIAIHGYAGRPPGDVAIEIEIGAAQVVVRIFDDGRSLDPASVSDPDLDALPERGMGIFILRSFVDQFEYAPGTPNRWTMRKRLPGPRDRP